MLSAFDPEHQLTHQDDDARFARNSSDVELITTLGQEHPRPVLLTADLYRVPAERKALREANLTVVFFRGGFHEQDFHTQAVKILSIWPEIVRQVTRCVEPTAFEIRPAARKVERLCRTRDIGG